MAYGDLKVRNLIWNTGSGDNTVVLSTLATQSYVTTNFAPKIAPTFTGIVTVPTATAGDNSTKAASTAFVIASFAPKSAPTFTGTINGVDLVLSGNLTVSGTQTIINTNVLQVEDKHIEIGKVSSPSDTTADGGGIILKASSDRTFLWVNATDAWTSSEHIQVASGKTFIGDGSTLTALNATNLSTGTVATARLGTGTASSSNYLRGDGSWQVPPQVGGATGVDFNDNVKARFGTGNDLEVFHSGTNAVIRDAGDGELSLQSNGAGIRYWDTANNTTMFLALTGASCELYEAGVKRLETTTDGINVTGQINVNGSALSAAPEITGTTDGAVTAGDPIIATSEGKLAKIAAMTKASGTPAIANDAYAGDIQVAYDKISGKVAAAFRESSKITVKVGTISGTTITWGTKVTATTDGTDPFDIGFHNNVILLGYRYSGMKARAATVSGTTVSAFGSEVSIVGSGNTYPCSCIYNEESQRWILLWHNSSNYPNYTQLVIGTISGTTPSFGSVVNVGGSEGVIDNPRVRNMPSVGKIVVFGIQDMYPEHRYQLRVGTINTSNNSVSWETQQELEWFGTEGGQDNEFDYYGTESDCDLAWHDDGKYAIAVARKGSDRKPYAMKLDYNETTKVFSYNRNNVVLLYDAMISNCIHATYLPDTKEIMTWWIDRNNNDYTGWIRWKTMKSSGEHTIQFIDPLSASANGNQLGSNDDTYGPSGERQINSVYAGAGKVLIGYRDLSASNKTYYVMQQFATTNAASQEFIGFASSSVGDNASLTVKVTGNTLTTSNLTAGKKHYVQNNGSLSTSPDTPSIEAGIALSSTKLLIKG